MTIIGRKRVVLGMCKIRQEVGQQKTLELVIFDLQRFGRQFQLFTINTISYHMRGQMDYFAFRIIYHTIKVKQIKGGAKSILQLAQ
jgi:hypothetical protein